MRKQILTALTAAVLIFTAPSSMAHDRGERKNQNHATTTQYNFTSARQVRTKNLLKPILALICSAGDCRLKVRGRHDFVPQRYYPGNFRGRIHRRELSRHGGFGHRQRHFRGWRKHQTWHERGGREYRRLGRRFRRYENNG